MCSEPVSVFLLLKSVSILAGDPGSCLSFLCYVIRLQIRDRNSLLKLGASPPWSPSPSFPSSASHYCRYSIIAFPLKAALWNSSSAFQMHLPQQVTGWRSEAEVLCPGGTATSNSNTLCLMLQKCTWKGFCFSKNAHVLSAQTRLLMFPCVQSSWTSERRTYLLWTVSS